MLNRRIRAIIFDMDGVLIDSETGIEELFRTLLKDIANLELTHDDYQRHFLGVTDPNGLRSYHAEHPTFAIEDILKRRSVGYRALIGKTILPFPKAENVLRAARDRYPVAIATSSNAWQVESLSPLIPWPKYVQVIVTADDITHSKPHPEIYLRAAEKLNVPPEDCLAIEDSLAGIQSAKAAGLTCWAVAQTHPASELRAADRIFDRIGNIDFTQIDWGGNSSAVAGGEGG